MEQRMEDIINRTVIANRLDSITGEMGLALEHSCLLYTSRAIRRSSETALSM